MDDLLEDLDDDRLNSISGLNAEAKLNWSPERGTIVALTFFRTDFVSSYPNDTFLNSTCSPAAGGGCEREQNSVDPDPNLAIRWARAFAMPIDALGSVVRDEEANHRCQSEDDEICRTQPES